MGFEERCIVMITERAYHVMLLGIEVLKKAQHLRKDRSDMAEWPQHSSQGALIGTRGVCIV